MRSPIKWHGGDHYHAPFIIPRMPKHTHYVEHFAGGCNVLLQKPIGASEVINDIHGGLTNFWQVLQKDLDFGKFKKYVSLIPYSQNEYDEAIAIGPYTGKTLEDEKARLAVAFFVLNRMSMSGRMKNFAPISRRVRDSMNENVSAYLGAIDGLNEVAQRFRSVAITNVDFRKSIVVNDGPDTLHYCDPPYVASVRTVDDVYDHEMSSKDHEVLLYICRQCTGKVMLANYVNPLYEKELRDWYFFDTSFANHSGSGSIKQERTERVYCNFTNGYMEKVK